MFICVHSCLGSHMSEMLKQEHQRADKTRRTILEIFNLSVIIRPNDTVLL